MPLCFLHHLPFVLHFFLHSLISCREAVHDLLLSWRRLLHPPVGYDLGHGWPVGGVQLEHAGQQLLQFF